MTGSCRSILSLPDDLLLLIMSFSRVDDTLSIRFTCKRFNTLSKHRWLWTDILKQQVINKGLPVPAATKDIKTLTSHDLETRAVHAAHFHENWTSGHPMAKRSLTFSVRPDHSLTPVHVTRVRFLPSLTGELIMTIVNHNTIMCWQVPLGLKTDPFQVAKWMDLRVGEIITNVVVNNNPTSLALFAVLVISDAGSSDILVFSLDKFRGELMILDRHSHDAFTSLHSLDGDLVLCGNLVVYNWREKTKLYQFRYPGFQNSERILVARSVYGYMITVRHSSICVVLDPFVYKEDPYCELNLTGTTIELPCHATEAAVFVRGLCHGSKKSKVDEPITVLLRCTDDGFDTIRQYDFIPSYEPMDQNGNCTREKQLITSVSTRVIPVSPSCYNLLFSPSGKGLWIETRNVPTGAVNSSRAARCLIGVDICNEQRVNDQEPKWRNLLNVGKEVYSRICGIMEVTTKSYRINCVDLEDCVGRIVIGDRDGYVQVLDYV